MHLPLAPVSKNSFADFFGKLPLPSHWPVSKIDLLGGLHSTVDSILASRWAARGSILGVSLFFH